MKRLSFWATAFTMVAAFLTAQNDATKAAEFTLKDTNGATHALAEQKGKVVVLEWTNKNCPIVQRHYKDEAMQKLAKKWAAKGIVWWAVDSTHDAKADAVEAWRKEQNVEQPVLLDPTGEVGKMYGAKTTPHMFIVKDGAILFQGGIDDGSKGEATVNYVEKALAEIAAGKPVSEPKAPPYGCSVKYAKAAKKADATTGWSTNWEAALKTAKAEKKLVLVDFTGSDWCIWCKRLKSEVFDTEDFKTWAAKNVVLLEIDFPKTAEMSKELKQQNAELKAKFGIKGYPTIVFVDGDGAEVGRSGYVEGGAKPWIEAAEHAMKK